MAWPEGHTGVHASGYEEVVYSVTQSSTSHVMETKVESYGGFPAVPGNEYGSPRKNGHRNSVHDSDHQFSPRGLARNSPRRNGTRDNCSPPENHYYENETKKRNGYIPTTYTVPISTQAKEPSNNRYREKDEADNYGARARGSAPLAGQTKNLTNYEALKNKPTATSPLQYNGQSEVDPYGSVPAMPSNEYGSPRKNGHRNSSHDHVNEKNHQFSPLALTKNSPWHNGTRDSSSPSRKGYNARRDHGTLVDDESDSDDEDGAVIRKDLVCVNKNTNGKDYYENEPNKTNGYTPPTYPVPISIHPKHGAYYEPSIHRHEENDKRGVYGARARDHDTAPFATQTKHVTNFDALKNNSIASSPPQYGKTSAGNGKNHPPGTITCKEAAERYKGFLISDK